MESYRNAESSVPKEFWGYYNLNEQLDSCGKVVDGKKHEEWLYFNVTSSKPDSISRKDHYDISKLINKNKTDQKKKDSTIEELVSFNENY